MSSHLDEHGDDETDRESPPDQSADDPAEEPEGRSPPEASSADRPAESDAGSSEASSSIGLIAAQDAARNAAETLLDHEFEGVIEVSTSDEDGWRALVEVVERHAVPDTQDIIGRYEITLNDAGDVTGYELRERYQRGDVKEEL